MSEVARSSDKVSPAMPEGDGPHQGLLDAIDELWTAVEAESDAQRIVPILDQLEQDARVKFAAEEALMRAAGYPSFREHWSDHKTFIHHITMAKRKLAAGASVGIDLPRFLTEWLVQHIEADDKDYARFKAAAQPRSESFLGRLFGDVRPKGVEALA